MFAKGMQKEIISIKMHSKKYLTIFIFPDFFPSISLSLPNCFFIKIDV